MQATTPFPAPELDVQLPPQNLEAERLVLSACLLDPEVIDDVMLVLKRDDFFRVAHQSLWSVMVDLRSTGVAVDATTAGDELERRGEFARFGGEDALGEIANAAPHSANVLHHAGIVKAKSQARGLARAATEIVRDVYSNMKTASELIESAEARVFAVRDDGLEGSTIDASTAVAQAMAEIERRRLGASQALSTGFRVLDRFVRLAPSKLIVLAARPSIGKTALAAQFIEHVAIEESTRVLFASLEMNHEELLDRMLSARSGVPGEKLKMPWLLTEAEGGAISLAAAVIDRALIEFADAPRQSVGQIAAMGRRMKHRGGLGLIVVDYLGLVEPRSAKGSTRQDDVAGISRDLKTMARELKVPVVALCQLNRQSESREDRRPRLADLRESGQIEQDADAVLLLHRPEFYDPEDQPGIAEVVVAKNRSGATGATKLKFVKACTRFEDLPPGWDQDQPDF